MSFGARVLADSISPQGVRLLTLEMTYPRIIHAEQMTHRVFSRNSASTRAIPLKNQIINLLDNPFVPEKFGINQPGMQSFRNLEGKKHEEAREIWLQGRDRALTTVIELLLGIELAGVILGYESTAQREYVHGDIIREKLPEILAHIPDSSSEIDLAETSLLNVHKQLAGRGLETYIWHTAVFTGTEWGNYRGLRDHPDAQGEIATIARLAKEAINTSVPRALKHGEWHLPYVEDGEFDDPADGVKASAARCAAVSYNRQASKRGFEVEAKRYDDLVSGGHMSPLEHQATPFSDQEIELREAGASTLRSEGERLGFSDEHIAQLVDSLQFNGNLRGWLQHRKTIRHENDFSQIVGGRNSA
jgi:hypothetical protein